MTTKTTTIALAIPTTKLQSDFCLIEWLFNFLSFVESNHIDIHFFKVTPLTSSETHYSVTFPDFPKNRPGFNLLIDLVFSGDNSHNIFILEEFIRKPFLNSETNFLLINKEKDITYLSNPFLYMSTEKSPNYTQISFFSDFIKKPFWYLELSKDWEEFFTLHKKNPGLRPGALGFLEICDEIRLDPFFDASDFNSPIKKTLILNFLFSPTLLDNFFTTLVKTENLRFVSFEGYNPYFHADRLVLELSPCHQEGKYCDACHGFCHTHQYCHYTEFFNNADFQCDCDCDCDFDEQETFTSNHPEKHLSSIEPSPGGSLNENLSFSSSSSPESDANS